MSVFFYYFGDPFFIILDKEITTRLMYNLKCIYIHVFLLLVSLLAFGCAPVEVADSSKTPQVLLSSTPSSASITTEPSASPSPAPTLTSTPVLFEEGSFVLSLKNGQRFEGRVRGHGSTVVILANMSSGDESQWAPLYESLNKDQYLIVTYPWLYNAAVIDETEVLLEHLRSAGFERVICIGASLGATACGWLANQPEMIGLVFIAGPVKHKLDEIEVPKLFIAGERDRFSRNTKLDYEQAAEPKEIVLYPTSRHGTDLFDSDHGDEFLDVLLTFIDETAASAP
jgi:pimeloyl-ACP methyl ester carboxylesterase